MYPNSSTTSACSMLAQLHDIGCHRIFDLGFVRNFCVLTMITAAAAATVSNDVRTFPNLSPCMIDFSFLLRSNPHLSNLAGTRYVAIVLQVTTTAPHYAQLKPCPSPSPPPPMSRNQKPHPLRGLVSRRGRLFRRRGRWRFGGCRCGPVRGSLSRGG